MQIFELSILNWIQTHLRCEVLDAVLPTITRLCDHGEIWIALALCLLLFKKHRKTGVTLACALILDLIFCNLLLKPLIGRIRPFSVNSAVPLLVPPPMDPSFPSGHTAVSFTATSALLGSGSRLWMPSLALSLVIAFSRLYLYLHWPSDVLGGAVLGAALGLGTAWLTEHSFFFKKNQ